MYLYIFTKVFLIYEKWHTDTSVLSDNANELLNLNFQMIQKEENLIIFIYCKYAYIIIQQNVPTVRKRFTK